VLAQEQWAFNKEIMPREATWVDDRFGVVVDTLIHGMVLEETDRNCIDYEDCREGETCSRNTCMRYSGSSKYYYAVRYFAVCPPE